MAKADMTIQINVSAPGLEVAVKALTDAIIAKNGDVVIPAGTAMQITGVEAVPTVAQPTQAVEQPAPMNAPVQEVAQPTPVAPAQVQQAAAPTPVPTAAPAQVQQVAAPAPAPIPVAQPAITLDAICNAGAKLVEQGQMNQVIGLLGKYGVQAVNQIKPEQFEAFAADLRGLGAQI